MSTIRFRNVWRSFGAVDALRDINLEIPNGRFAVFLGPSGCGKTTLMRVLAGLDIQTSGDVEIDGRVMNEATPAERGVGMVFQSYALYPHMTVRENIAFPLKMADVPAPEAKRRVEEVARILQAEHLLDRRPSQLSGGQKQRVAIGRTIVLDRKVFLFDEPLSNLDADLRVEMRLEIQRLHRRLGSTMVYVTHDQVEAMALGELIVVMSAGRIEQVGTPQELYTRPHNLFVATFLGSPKMNLLPAAVTAASSDRTRLALDTGTEVALDRGLPVAAGARVTLGIRPEDLAPSGGAIHLPFQLEMTENLGPNDFAYGQIGDARVTVQLARHSGVLQVPEGTLTVAPAAVHVFSEDGARLDQRTSAEAAE
jgi:lactose/L-arabinose transport system ATP-binding protein